MKQLILSLTVLAFLATASLATADSFDSALATIQKAGPSTAKVMVDKTVFTAPITFADGSSWDAVKDHYEVSPAVVDLLKAHQLTISVGSDGTASFAKTKK